MYTVHGTVYIVQHSSACSSVSMGISLKGRSIFYGSAVNMASAMMHAVQYLLFLAVPLYIPVATWSVRADMRILTMLRACSCWYVMPFA